MTRGQQILVRGVDSEMGHDWHIPFVTFLFNILNLNLKVLAALDVLVSISIRDVDVAIFAKRIQKKIAFPHAKPKFIA